MTQKLEDSGERRTFSTGAVRDRGDLKPRPDLISPHAQLREGMIMTLGSQKYALRNWEAGINISECLASAQRHIEQYKRGDTNEDHVAQARWNLGAIIHYEEEIKAGRMDPAIDDMPKYAYSPPCPICGGPVKSAYCPETGPEYVCVECGWTSLDASPTDAVIPKGTPGGYNPDGELVPYPPGDVHTATEDEICPQCGGHEVPIRDPKTGIEQCPECGWRSTDVMPDHPTYPTLTPVENAIPATTEMAFQGQSIVYQESMDPPIFYVAGPMRGYKDLNFPAFDTARDRGKALGYDIISPADLDREHGIDPAIDPTVVEHETEDMTHEELLAIIQRDLDVILSLKPERGDGIAVLNRWWESTGATAEVALAQWLGLKVVWASDFHTPVEVG